MDNFNNLGLFVIRDIFEDTDELNLNRITLILIRIGPH